MAEPTTSTSGVGLLSLLVILAGPIAGPYVYVLFGAVLGAFTALSAQRESGAIVRDGLFLLRVTCTALMFTAPVTLLITTHIQLPIEFVTGIAAYMIGWKWDALSSLLWPWLKAKLAGGAK